MRVLITGARGTIAGNLIRNGVLAGHEIVSVIRPGGEVPSLTSERVIYFDLTGKTGRLALSQKVDAIIHCAAITPKTAIGPADYALNLKFAESVCDLLASGHSTQLIFLSTGSVYGTGKSLNQESTNCVPIDAYGKSILESEQIFSSLSSRNPISILRLFYPFGFDSQTKQINMVSRLYKKILLGEKIVISSDAANAYFQPVLIDDVSAIIAGVLKTCWTGTLNICGREKVTLRTFIDMLGTIANRTPHIVEDRMTPNVIEADNQLLLSLGLSDEMTPLDQAIAIAVARLST